MSVPTTARDQSLQADPSAVARYDQLLRAYLRTEDEEGLSHAHEFGREMLDRGYGVLDMVALHQRAVSEAADGDDRHPSARDFPAASRLLFEVLTPFEMTYRGFRSANVSLHESEERYLELFENANDMVFTADLAGRLTSLNRAGERLTGYPRSEALTLDLKALFPQSSGAAPMAFSDLHGTEVEMLARDGRRVLLEISTRPVMESGREVGMQGIARDITGRRQAESALRHLNSHLEDKAKRIAHALHDEAGQLLATVYLRVAEISGELPPLGRRRMDELRTLLDQVDDQLRRLAYELRPTILDDLGLVPACQFLAEGVSRRSRVRVLVKGSTGGRLAADVETALYRVAQEALGNVGKHARARTATVEFERARTSLRGSIKDDGVGFDVNGVLSRIGPQGLGLMGMRERVVAIGGRLTVRSNPGKGTSVEFEVPLES
jgi:PAS domain S-box-containing protein